MDAIILNDQCISIARIKGIEFDSETITAVSEDPWIELRFADPIRYLSLEISIPEAYAGDYFSIYHSFSADSPLPSYSQEKSVILPLHRRGDVTRIIEFEFPVSYVRLDVTESIGKTGISRIEINAFNTLEDSLVDVIGNQPFDENGTVVNTHDLSNTGAPHLAFHIAKSLLEKDIPVVAVACDENSAALLDAYAAESLPIVSFDMLQGTIYSGVGRLIKIQRICDGLHNIGFKRAILNTLLSARYAEYYKYAGFNTISLIHETAETIKIQDWTSYAIDAATFSDYLVFPCKPVRQGFLDLVPGIEGEALIRPQGVYQESIQAGGINLPDIGIGPQDIVILGSGNCTLRKGYDLFVSAAIEMMNASPSLPLKFIWAGDFGNTLFDRDYRMRLAAQIEKSAVFGSFVQMPFCAPPAYKELLNRANLFWCTSRDDTFPSVVLEAMLARVPVVAFGSTGGVDTMLGEGRGKLVPGFDISTFVNDSITLFENSSQAAKIVNAAHSWVQSNLNFDEYAQWLIWLTKQPAIVSLDTCLDLRIKRIRDFALGQASDFDCVDMPREAIVDTNITAATKDQSTLASSEIKEALTRILEAFDSLCKEKGYRYSLAGGTLLGAIRHGGFIPWDDDIDLYIPRDDYEKLLSLPFPLDINGTTIDLRNNRNSSQPTVYSKIIDPSVLVYEPDKNAIGNLWIDVFPVEFMPEMGFMQADLQKARELNLEAWNLALSLKEMKRRRRADSRIRVLTKEIEETYSTGGSGASTVVELAWSNFFGGGDIKPYSASLFDDLVEVEFERRKYPAFRVWSEFLIRQYGKYWIIPKRENRQNHSIIAWREPQR